MNVADLLQDSPSEDRRRNAVGSVNNGGGSSIHKRDGSGQWPAIATHSLPPPQIYRTSTDTSPYSQIQPSQEPPLPIVAPSRSNSRSNEATPPKSGPSPPTTAPATSSAIADPIASEFEGHTSTMYLPPQKAPGFGVSDPSPMYQGPARRRTADDPAIEPRTIPLQQHPDRDRERDERERDMDIIRAAAANSSRRHHPDRLERMDRDRKGERSNEEVRRDRERQLQKDGQTPTEVLVLHAPNREREREMNAMMGYPYDITERDMRERESRAMDRTGYSRHPSQPHHSQSHSPRQRHPVSQIPIQQSAREGREIGPGLRDHPSQPVPQRQFQSHFHTQFTMVPGIPTDAPGPPSGRGTPVFGIDIRDRGADFTRNMMQDRGREREMEQKEKERMDRIRDERKMVGPRTIRRSSGSGPVEQQQQRREPSLRRDREHIGRGRDRVELIDVDPQTQWLERDKEEIKLHQFHQLNEQRRQNAYARDAEKDLQREREKVARVQLHLGTFIWPRTPFPYFFDIGEGISSQNDNQENFEVETSTLLTILIPNGFIPDSKPEIPKIWGGGLPPPILCPPMTMTMPMPTVLPYPNVHMDIFPNNIPPSSFPAESSIPKGNAYCSVRRRRIYTDDSDLFLATLHSGYISWSSATEAKQAGKGLKLEIRVVRCAGGGFGIGVDEEKNSGTPELKGKVAGKTSRRSTLTAEGEHKEELVGRFLGGRGARFIGLPSRQPSATRNGFRTKDDDGQDGGDSDIEDDGRGLISAGWGSGHDGSGIEVLSAEWIDRVDTISTSIRTRAQRLLEYGQRRAGLLEPKKAVTRTPTPIPEDVPICRKRKRTWELPSIPRRIPNSAFLDAVEEEDAIEIAEQETPVLMLGFGESTYSQGGAWFKYSPVLLNKAMFPHSSTSPDSEEINEEPSSPKEEAAVEKELEEGEMDEDEPPLKKPQLEEEGTNDKSTKYIILDSHVIIPSGKDGEYILADILDKKKVFAQFKANQIVFLDEKIEIVKGDVDSEKVCLNVKRWRWSSASSV